MNLISKHKKYFVHTPDYDKTSGGNRVMWKLMDMLKERGEEVHYIDHQVPDINTGITIYPEIYKGNKFNSPCVVRYLLNRPGFNGRPTEFEGELLFAFSKRLLLPGMNEDRVLFIPVADTKFFKPNPDVQRHGCVYFVGKAQGCAMNPITNGCREITLRNPATWEELALLFQKSEVFYTYTSTGLIAESCLCGCPTVFIENDHAGGVRIDKGEYGNTGISDSISVTDIDNAKSTVKDFQQVYDALVKQSYEQLDRFIRITQEYYHD